VTPKSSVPELETPQAGTRRVLGAMTTIAPGLKKYVEREAPADAPPARPGSKVHVHFTATVRSSDVVVDSSRGEFTTEVGGVTVRKCNVPLALTLPGVGAAERVDAPGFDASASSSAAGASSESRRGEAGRAMVGTGTNRHQTNHPTNENTAARSVSEPRRLDVRGFVMGVLTMRLGERATFCVDAHLAYGERGKGVVGPNEAMDFDVELVGVDGEYFPARRGR
jgi:hypothetical protein